MQATTEQRKEKKKMNELKINAIANTQQQQQQQEQQG